MRLIDADALLQKRAQAKDYGDEMYVIGQGYVMDAPTIDIEVDCTDTEREKLEELHGLIADLNPNEITSHILDGTLMSWLTAVAMRMDMLTVFLLEISKLSELD